MNANAIIATLVLKNIISQDEGEKLVEHLNNKPQSTVLSDAIADVTPLLNAPAPPLMPPVGSMAGPAQVAEEAAARAATPVAPAGAMPADDKPQMPDDANDSSTPERQNIDDANAAAAADEAASVGQSPEPSDKEKADIEAAKKAEKEGGETYTPESDKDTASDGNAKPSSVKKSTSATDKK
jgi:hypothetical protein